MAEEDFEVIAGVFVIKMPIVAGEIDSFNYKGDSFCGF
jgi:hypothetical protein